MQNQNNPWQNPTPVATPNPGLVSSGISAAPTILPPNQQTVDGVVSSLTPISSPSIQAQEAFMDQSSLEGQSQDESIDTGSLLGQGTYNLPKIKHRSSKTPFVITGLTLVVALLIAGLGSYFAKQTKVSSLKSISQQIAEQSVDPATLSADPLSLIAPADETGQQLLVNGNADITGTIVATNFSGNGSAITNLKASNCVDCIALQPETPGPAQVGGINVTGSGLFGKLGVGTQTPAYSVDVLGDVNASTSIKVGGITVCTVAGCISQNAITPAVTKLNNLTGPINLQGVAADQIIVTQVGNNLSLSLPQGISTTSTPSFASLTLTSSLAVASGGTGGTAFTQYGLLVGNGVNGLTVTSPQSSAGLCLISNTGAAPSFQACPGGVGGSSVSTSAPGTADKLAKFTAANEISDSSISDNSITVNIGVPLSVNGSVNATGLVSSGALAITPGSDLTVGAINQKFTLQGSSTSVITARSGSNTTTVGFVEPTSPDKTVLFPNESGTLCLQNSVNCGFALSGSGVSSLNSLTSAVTLVGTANRVIVTNGASIVLSAPQDIATSSSPQFAGLNLTGNLTLGSTSVIYTNNLTQTVAGQSITVDAGVDGITLKANNRTFILPTSGGANQTICTTGISCVAGGGQAVLLAVGSAQTDNTTSPSIYIDKTNSGGNILQLQTSGIDKLIVDGNGILKINTVVPISGTFTLGNVANAFDIQGDGASTISSKTGLFTTTVGFAAASANKTISFPNLDGTVCLSSGNCSGAAAALTTPGGTIGRLTKFTGVQEIDNSIIGEDSLTSVVTINSGSLVIQGAPLSSALTLGVAGLGGVTGKIDFKNATNSNTVSLQSGTTSVNGLTFTLPTTGGSSGQCITTDGSGVLGYSTCLSGAGGGAGGVTSLNGISGVVNINGTTNQVNVNLASGASPMTLSLPQSIASTSDVAFKTLSLSGSASAGISIGSIGSSGRIILSDGAATPHTVSLLPATQTVNKTITIPDFSGASATLPLTASGFISITAAGDIQTTGQLSVASGGTNASTISGARSNLGAAASGANSDITSTTVLNTITPSGSLTVGSNNFSFTLQGNAASAIKATSGSFAATLSFITPTGNRSIQLPDESGTVCTTGSICSGYASSSSLSGVSGVASNSVQLQATTPGTPQTGNLNISGVGIFGSGLTAGSGGLTVTAGGANIGGNISQTGTGTLSTGTGAVSLNGATSVTGTNTFNVGTGTSTFAGGNISQTGTGTLSTGTGAVSLNGATTLTANFIQTGAATTFLQKSDSATAFQLQDAGGNEGLLFDTSTNHLKIFDNIAGTSGAYADIYYSGGAAVFAASTGGTTIGNGTGNVDITLANNSEKFNFVHNGTATPSADTDFYISRALTGGVNNLSGAVLKVEDLSSGSGTNTTDILSINQSNVSSTGNLIIAVTGSITEKFKVSNSGVVTSLGNMNTTGGAIQTASVTRIDNSGNLTGIGTISASYLTSTSLAALKLVNTASVFDFASTDGNTAILKIPQKLSGLCSASTAEGLIIQNAAGTQNGHMCIDSAGLKIYANQINTGGTDVAENYSDPSNTIEPGDLVALIDDGSIRHIEKASPSNASRLFGVAATSPGMLLSGISESGISDLINPKAIALSGRIPTKVSTENGNIAVGDYLTVSSTIGVAMRATGPSMVIGRALQGYSGVGVAKIEVMAQSFYFAGASVVDALQNGAVVNLTVTGGINGSSLQVISSITETLEVSAGAEIWTLHVSGSASFEGVVDIASNLNVGGTLKVVGMSNFQSITVEGKIITAGIAPSAVLAATTGISAATTISGNDVAGNISYTAGSESLPANPLTAGEQVSLTFNSAYSAGPRVVLTAKNSASAAVRYYIDSTASGFKLYFLDTPLPNTNYSFDYLVVQ